MRFNYIGIVLMLLTPIASAEQVATPRTTVLKAARLFDSLSGKLIEPGMIVVTGDKIQAVGANLAVPKGATIIDLGNVTLIPGLIDSHVHLASEYNENWFEGFYKGIMRFPAEQALYAAQNAKKTLEAGFTTVRDVGSHDYVAASLRNAINAGVVPGPRMLVSNYAIGATGGHADAAPYPPDRIPPQTPVRGTCNGAEQCREAVRYQIKYGADVIKFMPSGGVLSLADSVDSVQLTQEEMNAIVSEAHTLGRKVAAHCHGDLAGKMAIKAGVDSIEHGTFLKDDTLLEMKKNGVYLVPTLFAPEWLHGKEDKYPTAIRAKITSVVKQIQIMFQHAVKLGVPIAFGTDAAVEPHGMNAQEFTGMTRNGMAPADALMAATTSAAKLLGVDKETGTLEAGKAADIIALPGNPLMDIHATEHPTFVMKAGVVYVGGK
jgi:imidazolonepropionase-like amidohydrolase